MEELQSLLPVLVDHLPARWLEVLGAVFAACMALRTLLRAAVGVCYAVDLAVDGELNWAWVGRFGDFLDRIDSYLARSRWFPAKAPGLKGRL